MRNPAKAITQLILRRWQFMTVIFSLSMIAGIYLLFTLPRVYIATISMLTDLKNIPESSRETNPTLILLSIKGRAYLNHAIKAAELFTGPEYEDILPDEKIVLMRKNLSTSAKNVQGKTMLTISLRESHPEKVAKAVSSLANFFIDERIRTVTENLLGARALLEEKMNVRTYELELVENALKDYRKKHKKSLSGKLDANLNMLEKLRNRLNNAQESLSTKKISQIQLEGEAAKIREDMERYVHNPLPGTVPPASDESLKLKRLRKEYAKLTARYTQRHPDVVKMKAKLGELEAGVAKQAAAIAKQVEVEKNKTDAFARQYRYSKTKQLKAAEAENNALKREIKKHRKNVSALRRQIRIYEKRIENTPKTEQYMMTLNRACENIQRAYQLLLKKKLDADTAVTEWEKSGPQNFRILEPARTPQKPVSPDIRKLFLFSLGAGLGISAGLALLLELFGKHRPKPEHPKSRIRRILNIALNIVLILTASALLAGFAFLISEGVGYVDQIAISGFPDAWFTS